MADVSCVDILQRLWGVVGGKECAGREGTSAEREAHSQRVERAGGPRVDLARFWHDGADAEEMNPGIQLPEGLLSDEHI